MWRGKPPLSPRFSIEFFGVSIRFQRFSPEFLSHPLYSSRTFCTSSECADWSVEFTADFSLFLISSLIQTLSSSFWPWYHPFHPFNLLYAPIRLAHSNRRTRIALRVCLILTLPIIILHSGPIGLPVGTITRQSALGLQQRLYLLESLLLFESSYSPRIQRTSVNTSKFSWSLLLVQVYFVPSSWF